ncbi:MAG: 2-oxoglutarate dehydrogenase complex dihydrolipoyllysine-residue succinyltransferase, partial [Pseudomonadota bacterium]
MATEVRVPTLGESVTEATIATWFKQPGDAVAVDEMLCELETDKVTVEVPSPADGVMVEHVAKEGDTVGVDALLATIEAGAAAAAAAPKPAAAEAPAPAPAPTQAPAAAHAGGNGSAPVAPSAARMMAEKGIDPASITGTGKDGRVMKEDVQRAASGRPAPVAAKAPAVDETAREKRVKMTRLRQTIARRLKDAQNTAAMLTTYNEVDMSGIMALRNEFKEEFVKKHGVKLGFMSFFVKACCHALHEIPAVNAEIDGAELVYKNYYHVGVAVGTPTGLVVPVVRNADQMGFSEIEKTIAGLGEKARDGKLTMADMQGGTFTISNGGVYGSLMSSPILNPPQSGILGMHKIQERPMVVGGQIVARP